jgi:hypothetical protein
LPTEIAAVPNASAAQPGLPAAPSANEDVMASHESNRRGTAVAAR